MSIDVERHVHILSYLNIETLKPVFTEDREDHSSGILSIECLEHKFLNFPITSCRGTRLHRERLYDFSL